MVREERSAGMVIFRRTGIVVDDVEFLLLDYGRHWDFPKGHLEKGEDDLTAAVRELREETGITDARVLHGFRHEIVYFFRHPRRGLIRKTVIFFLGEVSHPNIRLSHEHEGYAYLPFAAARERVTFPTAKKLLDGAMQRLSAGDG